MRLMLGSLRDKSGRRRTLPQFVYSLISAFTLIAWCIIHFLLRLMRSAASSSSDASFREFWLPLDDLRPTSHLFRLTTVLAGQPIPVYKVIRKRIVSERS